jgi:hypothetical protein
VAWLDTLRSGAYSNTLNGSSAEYNDPAGGRYRAVYSSGGIDQAGNSDPGTLVGYVGTDGPWHPGQVGHNFDTNGRETSTFTVTDPNQLDWADKYLPAIILSVGAAGAFGLLGPDAAFGAGSVSSSQVGAAASLQAGESLATAAPAGGSGAFLGEGVASGVPAWDAAYTTAGGAFTTGAGAVANVAAGGSSLVSSAVGAATKVLGALTTIAGIKGQAARRPSYATAQQVPDSRAAQLAPAAGPLAGLNSHQVLTVGILAVGALLATTLLKK